MPVIALIVLNQQSIIQSKFELSQFGYFSRSVIRNILIAVAKETRDRLGAQADKRITIQLKRSELEPWSGFMHYKCSSGKYYIIVTDTGYSHRIAHDLGDIALQGTISEEVFKSYQTPEKFDKITGISNDLDETKEIIFKSVDQLLHNGEKLEDLVDKTHHLEKDSRTFLIISKKLNNRCCCII